MTHQQKERCLKRIYPSFKWTGVREEDHALLTSGGVGEDHSFDLTGLPEMFKTSWKNARTILQKDGISKVPGTANTLVVMSITAPDKLHFVHMKQGGQTLECDCMGFSTKKLCAHTLAVAKQKNILSNVNS